MSEISKEDMHMIRERLDAVRDMFRHGQLQMDNVAEYAALNDVPALLAHIEALEAELDAARDALVWITSLPYNRQA